VWGCGGGSGTFTVAGSTRTAAQHLLASWREGPPGNQGDQQLPQTLARNGADVREILDRIIASPRGIRASRWPPRIPVLLRTGVPPPATDEGTLAVRQTWATTRPTCSPPSRGAGSLFGVHPRRSLHYATLKTAKDFVVKIRAGLFSASLSPAAELRSCGASALLVRCHSWAFGSQAQDWSPTSPSNWPRRLNSA